MTFVTLFIMFNVLMTMIWETALHEKVYNCTDSIPFGYLSPGGWVHGRVETVAVIRDDVPMGDPDTILEGWTQSRLWSIWIFMFAGSILASMVCTWAIVRTAQKDVAGQTDALGF